VLEHRLYCGDDATRDLGDGTIAVDGNEATIVVEPLEQRSSLALEDVEAPLDHVGVVIGTARLVESEEFAEIVVKTGDHGQPVVSDVHVQDLTQAQGLVAEMNGVYPPVRRLRAGHVGVREPTRGGGHGGLRHRRRRGVRRGVGPLVRRRERRAGGDGRDDHADGADGKGSTKADAKGPDLTTIAKRNGGKFPFYEVMLTISGRSPTGQNQDTSLPGSVTKPHGDGKMPSWGQIFAQQEGSTALDLQLQSTGKIMLITEYLQSIQAK